MIKDDAGWEFAETKAKDAFAAVDTRTQGDMAAQLETGDEGSCGNQG